jgi:branched-chain amino acid transport system ATP-binding protein
MLKLQNITGGYGRITILNKTSFAIPKGSITTIIGPNGAGKSTVFKAIFGLLSIQSGSILLDGNDVTHKQPAEMIARGVTYVPQGRNIVPQLSVFHNLELGGITAKDQRQVRARMERVMDQFPMLRERKDQKAAALSGGQQKQLEVARALLLEPKLILVDEPSIGLSPNLVQEVFQTLIRLRDQGVTILMVEQNAKAALAVSDYGLVLELGQTRLFDAADKLLNDPRVGQLFLGGHVEEPTGAEGIAAGKEQHLT